MRIDETYFKGTETDDSYQEQEEETGALPFGSTAEEVIAHGYPVFVGIHLKPRQAKNDENLEKLGILFYDIIASSTMFREISEPVLFEPFLEDEGELGVQRDVPFTSFPLIRPKTYVNAEGSLGDYSTFCVGCGVRAYGDISEIIPAYRFARLVRQVCTKIVAYMESREMGIPSLEVMLNGIALRGSHNTDDAEQNFNETVMFALSIMNSGRDGQSQKLLTEVTNAVARNSAQCFAIWKKMLKGHMPSNEAIWCRVPDVTSEDIVKFIRGCCASQVPKIVQYEVPRMNRLGQEFSFTERYYYMVEGPGAIILQMWSVDQKNVTVKILSDNMYKTNEPSQYLNCITSEFHMNDMLSISRLAKILVKNGCGSSYISSEIERSNGQKYGLFKNFLPVLLKEVQRVEENGV